MHIGHGIGVTSLRHAYRAWNWSGFLEACVNVGDGVKLERL